MKKIAFISLAILFSPLIVAVALIIFMFLVLFAGLIHWNMNTNFPD